jgi:hypothetical protein
MELKDVQKPSHEELIRGDQILHPTPEVAQIEVVQPREEEGEDPAEVGVEVIRPTRDARLGLELSCHETRVILAWSDLLQEDLWME